MSQRIIGRHRAPSPSTVALSRTLKVGAVAVTSGGLVAAAIVPANAGPRGVVEDVTAVVAERQHGVEATVSTLTVDLPAAFEALDRPVVAAVAPQDVDTTGRFGTAGFVGVEPEPEPVVEEPEVEPEPVVEEPEVVETEVVEVAEPVVEEPEVVEASAETSDREETSSSRSTERAAAPAVEAAPAPASGGVLSIAASLTGIPYVWAGSSPSTGFDCSGFTSYVYAQVGIDLPRTAAAQQAAATPVSNPQPGDLVFWGYPANHVGIYAGNGMLYDAGRSGLQTQYREIWGGVSGYGRVG